MHQPTDIGEIFEELAYYSIDKASGVSAIKDHHTDKCPICIEDWQKLKTIIGQRQWKVSDACDHYVCTSCYWKITNFKLKYGKNIEERYEETCDIDSIDPEDPLKYQVARQVKVSLL